MKPETENKRINVMQALRERIRQDTERYQARRERIRAGIVERMTVRKVDPNALHANPDDEFTDPKIGPNEGIISSYIDQIKDTARTHAPIFKEPVIVEKVEKKEYMIINGHHRWVAAMRMTVPKLRVSIVNPKNVQIISDIRDRRAARCKS